MPHFLDIMDLRRLAEVSPVHGAAMEFLIEMGYRNRFSPNNFRQGAARVIT